jgi:hypothetical protein
MIAEKNTSDGTAFDVDLIRGSDCESFRRDICHEPGVGIRERRGASPLSSLCSLFPDDCTRCSPQLFLFLNYNMESSSIVLLYRYYLFCMSSELSTKPSYLQSPSTQVIIIVSNAIICSAAAWNLPISQNAGFHGKMATVPDKAASTAHLQSQLSCISMST